MGVHPIITFLIVLLLGVAIEDLPNTYNPDNAPTKKLFIGRDNNGANTGGLPGANGLFVSFSALNFFLQLYGNATGLWFRIKNTSGWSSWIKTN